MLSVLLCAYSDTGQHVTSHTPELNEPSTSALGTSGQPLQPNSKPYADEFQSSGSVFTSTNRKVGIVHM